MHSKCVHNAEKRFHRKIFSLIFSSKTDFPDVYNLHKASCEFKTFPTRLERENLVLVVLRVPDNQVFSSQFTGKIKVGNEFKMTQKTFPSNIIFHAFLRKTDFPAVYRLEKAARTLKTAQQHSEGST